MATIYTRAAKGSALTWTEGDANITNLNNDKIEDIVEDTTPQLGGNLDVNGQQIVSVSNGNIVLAPNGTGSVVLDGLNWPQSDGTNGQVLTTNGSGQLSFTTASGGGGDLVDDTTPQLGGNLDVADFKIQNSTGNEGYIRLDNFWVFVGVSNSTTEAKITTDLSPIRIGPQECNYSNILIARNENSNITLTPHGTGIVAVANNMRLNAQKELRFGDSDSSHYVGFKSPATVSTNKIWTLPSADGTSGQVLSTDGSGTLSWATAGGGGNNIIHLTLPNNMAIGSVPSSDQGGNPDSQSFTLRSDGGISGISVNAFGTPNFTLPAGTYMLKMPTMITHNSNRDSIKFMNRSDSTQVQNFNFRTMTINGTANCAFWAQPATVFTIASSKRFSFESGGGTAFTVYTDHSNNLFQFEIHKLS